MCDDRPGWHQGYEEAELSGEIVLDTGSQVVTLVEDPARPGAYLVRIGGTDQSYVDLADPLRLEFDYVQRIADVVDEIAPDGERIRIVHIGGAALTLPRYVTATRPSSAQIVLEPDEELTRLVREHLPLPRQSGIKIRAVDGRAGIAAMRDGFADLVIVDAFAGARVPAELTTRRVPHRSASGGGPGRCRGDQRDRQRRVGLLPAGAGRGGGRSSPTWSTGRSPPP